MDELNKRLKARFRKIFTARHKKGALWSAWWLVGLAFGGLVEAGIYNQTGDTGANVSIVATGFGLVIVWIYLPQRRSDQISQALEQAESYSRDAKTAVWELNHGVGSRDASEREKEQIFAMLAQVREAVGKGDIPFFEDIFIVDNEIEQVWSVGKAIYYSRGILGKDAMLPATTIHMGRLATGLSTAVLAEKTIRVTLAPKDKATANQVDGLKSFDVIDTVMDREEIDALLEIIHEWIYTADYYAGQVLGFANHVAEYLEQRLPLSGADKFRMNWQPPVELRIDHLLHPAKYYE